MKRILTVAALSLLFPLFFSNIAHAQGALIYASLSDEDNVAIIDPGTSKLLQRIQVGRDPMSLVLNADKSKLYVSNTGDISVSIISLAEKKVTQVLRLPVNRRGIYAGVMTSSWDGTKIFIGERGEDENAMLRIYVIDTEKEAVVGQFDAGKNINSISVSTDGKKVYVVNKEIGISVYDTETYRKRGSVKMLDGLANKVWAIGCSPAKQLAYISYGDANKIQALNTANDKTTATIDMPKYKKGIQKGICFSPDGRHAFVINHKNTYREIDGINIIDASKNEVIKIFNSGVVLCGISVTQDSKTCYVASADLKWYNLETLEHIRSISLRTTIGDIMVVE